MTTNQNTVPSAGGRARPILLTAAYYASLAALGLVSAAAGPSLPTLAGHTSSPLDRISLIFVVSSFGYLLGSMAGGRLYDRLPGHRLIAAMLMIMVGAAIGMPVASVLWVLLLLSFFLGLGNGAVDVGCNTLLQWLHGDRVSPFMNGLHFSFGLGSFFAPLLLARIISVTHEIYWVYWIIAILIVPLAIWIWFLPAPPRQSHNAIHSSVRVPSGPVLLMMLAFLLYVGAELGFSNWIYTYALTLKLADTISAAYLTSAYWAFFTLGRLLGIWVSTRLRSQTILFVDFAGCLFSLALIGVARDSTLVLWFGSASLGIFTASIFPTLLILAGERLQMTGTITGLFLLGGGAGSMLLPWLIGLAFTRISPYAMILMLWVDLLLGLAVVMLFVYGDRSAPRVASPANTGAIQ